MQRKLLGIIRGEFDGTGQLLIIHSAYIKYLRKKIGKVTITLFICIRLFVRNSINSAHETIQPPLAEVSWNFMLEDFLKISMDIHVLLKFESNYG